MVVILQLLLDDTYLTFVIG